MKTLVTTIMALASLAYAEGGATPTLNIGDVGMVNWNIGVPGGTPVMSDDDEVLTFTYYRTRIYTDEQQDWTQNPVVFLNGSDATGKYALDFPMRPANIPSKDFYVLDFYIGNNSDMDVQLNTITFDIIVLTDSGEYVDTSVLSGPGLVIRPQGGSDVDASAFTFVTYTGDTHVGKATYNLAPFEGVQEGSTIIAPGEQIRISFTQNNLGSVQYNYGVVGGTVTYQNLPEPTAGALSLLALAGLAARKRRKG